MKKILMLLLAGVMTVSLVACGNSSSGSKDSLIYGSTTDLSGEFYNGWTIGASDVYVRQLVLGYPLVASDQAGELVYNKTLLKDVASKMNADGSKTFTFTMNEGLKYNEGTEIKAQDYVFSIVLAASKQLRELEATGTTGKEFVGYDAFNKGETTVFEGVRLLGDYEFSITVDASELPNYFEKQFFGLDSTEITATPMHVVAPSAKLTDTEKGVEVTGLTTEELTKTLLDPTTGYRYNPQVTSGPYNLKSFDANTKTATLELNKEFQGNFEGQKPSIQTVVFKKVTQETALAELESGAINFFNASGVNEIEAGKKLEDAGKVSSVNYPRLGYGYLNFHMNKDATQFTEIRQAINYSLDKNEFVKQFAGSYAQVVYAEYALGQWQFKEKESELTAQLNNYSYNPDKAIEVLTAAGWVFNADGSDYTSGTRYKKVDGQLVPAKVNWLGTVDNAVTTIVKTLLPDALKKVGIELVITEKDFSTLLAENQNVSSEFTMFNLAFNFSSVDDPKTRYTLDQRFWGVANTNFSTDQKLADLAAAVAQREPEDKEGYLKAWFEFQTYFNEQLPRIPLYSNQYFDFFSSKVTGVETSSVWRFPSALLYVSIK